MWKINEGAIGKNQQLVSLKVLIFRLHYITIYFADIEFPNIKSVTIQVFAFSMLKKQTPKSPS